MDALVEYGLHLLAALLAGAVIGTERSFHGRGAGFRTHTLVAMASAVLMLVTLYTSRWLAVTESVRMDPARMAQGIMTGIGFLGAGVIFKEGVTVRGLTTAASIWITAAIGILMGVGLYGAGALSTVLTLGVLAVFREFEIRFPTQRYIHLALQFARDEAMDEDAVRAIIRQHGFDVSSMDFHLGHGGHMFEYRMAIRTTDPARASSLVATLRSLPIVRGFTVSHVGTF